MSFYYDNAQGGTKAAQRTLPALKINSFKVKHLRFLLGGAVYITGSNID